MSKLKKYVSLKPKLGVFMTEEQKKLADSYRWWHRIKLSDDYITPGECPHGTGVDVETRFGLPQYIEGSVLDIGAWDGLFSFEAEKRGARSVTAIDVYQNPHSAHEFNAPFKLAKEVLNSNVDFHLESLESYNDKHIIAYDYIFHFGILYHIKNPLNHVERLMELILPGGTILLETTISNTTTAPSLEYRPRYDGDHTNFYYPNKEWVELAFMENGAKSVECFYNDGSRATFRIQA